MKNYLSMNKLEIMSNGIVWLKKPIRLSSIFISLSVRPALWMMNSHGSFF